MLRILREQLIEPFPKSITWMFGIHQEFMTSWNQNNSMKIDFVEGLDFSKVKKHSILVIDDLMLSNNKEVAEMYILKSHHDSVSTFFLCQNLFPNDPLFRLMSLNSHYFVLFQNPRNQRQVFLLASQAFQDLSAFKLAYKRASMTPRGFIVLNFNPLLPKEVTIITDFWSKYISVYI